MAKQKKDGVRISCFIRRDVKEKLDIYCKDAEKSTTMAIETILDEYLAAYFKAKEQFESKEKGVTHE